MSSLQGARARSAPARRTAKVMARSSSHDERHATGVTMLSRAELVTTSAAVANLLVAGAALAEESGGGFPV